VTAARADGLDHAARGVSALLEGPVDDEGALDAGVSSRSLTMSSTERLTHDRE
jgi:hypothetical protein